MFNRLLNFILLPILLLNLGWQSHPTEIKAQSMDIKKIQCLQNEISYPYVASKERSHSITKAMNTLIKGMRVAQVIDLLQAPDEVHYTYKAIKSKSARKPIGFSMVYLLERRKPSGSVLEKAERLIRIHFDTHQQLISAYAIKVKEFQTIE
jgi:hypothetical protein